MTEGADAWIGATPCQQASAVSPEAPLALTLSPQHKRELASIAAAGVASAAFFLVPLLTLTEPERLLPASPVVIQLTAAPAPPISLTLKARVARARVASPRLPRRDLPTAMVAATSASVSMPEHPVEFRKTPGRLSRVLLGDGRYRVQPFPLLSDQN